MSVEGPEGTVVIKFQIHLKAATGDQDQLEQVLADEFVPAVRRQPGFIAVEVLRSYQEQPGNSPGLLREGYHHQVVLTFLDEAHRQHWAASGDHATIFPRVRALTQEIRGAGYEVLERCTTAETAT